MTPSVPTRFHWIFRGEKNGESIYGTTEAHQSLSHNRKTHRSPLMLSPGNFGIYRITGKSLPQRQKNSTDGGDKVTETEE